MSGRRVDLDAAKKARAEKNGEPPLVVLDGREFPLPPSLPAAVMVGIADAQRATKDDKDGTSVKSLVDALEALFGDNFADVVRLGLDLDDINVIIEEAYGTDPGEASGSAT